jgi:hypothetical protein
MAWAIPENLLKEMVDLEAILVVIIDRSGKAQKVRFGKILVMRFTIRVQCERSRRQNPQPPIPKELSDDMLEIGESSFSGIERC